jgi:hypothetical protein
MASPANVHLVLNSRDSVDNTTPLRPAPYQTTSYATRGQNLVQGQIEKLSVNEVNFPYDIPNVLGGYNFFNIFSLGYPVPGNQFQIVVPSGFYTGTELATAINAEIVSTMTAGLIPPSDQPAVSYDTASNLFTFEAPVAPVDPQAGDVLLSSPFVFSNDANYVYGKDLLSIMGFKRYQGYQNSGRFTTAYPLTSTSAPLTFTQYIDICSPELCQFQELKTGNTTNFSRRTDIICRLYVSNNISVNDAGYRPFIINRQYTNERMMRWTADNSVGNMSIQLYDDLGEPLKYEWRPRDFQITFNVYERERSIGSGSVIRP